MSYTTDKPDSTSDKPDDKPAGFLTNLMNGRTPGVSNIEAAYSRAGASNSHTPGSATTLGSQDQASKPEDRAGSGGHVFFNAHGEQSAEQPSMLGKVLGSALNTESKSN